MGLMVVSSSLDPQESAGRFDEELADGGHAAELQPRGSGLPSPDLAEIDNRAIAQPVLREDLRLVVRVVADVGAVENDRIAGHDPHVVQSQEDAGRRSDQQDGPALPDSPDLGLLGRSRPTATGLDDEVVRPRDGKRVLHGLLDDEGVRAVRADDAHPVGGGD